MLDGVSLDQIRSFIAAVDEGSFSAAARKLGRVQSAVSDMVRSLESQIGVDLFLRAGRVPQLTEAGKAMLADARAIIAGVDTLKARGRAIAAGLEPELSVVFSVLYSIASVAAVAEDFHRVFPSVPLRIHVEAMGGALQLLLEKRASVAVLGPWPAMPPGIVTEPVDSVSFVTVSSPKHPLASHDGVIPNAELAKHIQLVLSDRSELSQGQEFGVISPRTWRLADLSAKRMFLVQGLGWGGMPSHAVKAELDDGRLIRLATEERAVVGGRLRISAAYRADEPPGPAGRWLIERLRVAKDHADERKA